MDQEVCENCVHYHRHYVLDEREFLRAGCGHCGLGKLQRKLPDASACDRYVPGPPRENVPAAKQYLSKALLGYLLSLKPLPEIMDLEEAIDEKPPKPRKKKIECP